MNNTIHIIYSKNKWVLKREGEDKTLAVLGIKTFKHSEVAFYYATLIATRIIVHQDNGMVKFSVLTSMLTYNLRQDD